MWLALSARATEGPSLWARGGMPARLHHSPCPTECPLHYGDTPRCPLPIPTDGWHFPEEGLPPSASWTLPGIQLVGKGQGLPALLVVFAGSLLPVPPGCPGLSWVPRVGGGLPTLALGICLSS